jgi:very-short-patch-repair endonuclease
MVECGKWVQLDTRVFAVGSAPATWPRQMTAAVLSRPVALVAGRSAGYLHEFPGFRSGRPEILVPFAGNARSPLARVIRSRHFEQIASARVRGFQVTSVAETVLTLSYRESWETIELLVDDQLAAGRLAVPDFDPIFDRLIDARLRSLPMLRRIVADRSEDAYQPPTTELERLLYRALDSEELPTFERQIPFEYETTDATVDAYIPSWRLIVEGDGRRWHTRKADFERDRERDNAAAAAGLQVVRFTYRMLQDDLDRCHRILIETGRWRQ